MKTYQEIFNWFYAPVAKQTTTLFRIGCGLMVLLHAIILAPWLTRFYITGGYIPESLAASLRMPQQWTVLSLSSNALFVYICYGLLVIAAVCILWNRFTVYATLIAYTLLFSFVNRFPIIYYGGFQFLYPALFCLFFISLLPLLKKNSGWPIHALQLYVCCIYIGSALLKLQSPGWFGGNQLLAILNIYGTAFNFAWLQLHPTLVSIFTYGTMFVELSFVFLIWTPLRRVLLVALVLMHIAIALTLNVTFLSEVMLVLLVSFLNEQDWRDLGAFAGKFWPKVRNLLLAKR